MIFFAVTSANQNDLVEIEARNAGSENVKVTGGGVFFTGDIKVGYRFCLWSRSATRVMVLFNQKEISSIDEFYQYTSTLPWENYLTPQSTFSISETVSDCSWLRNTHYASVRLKDAIVDRIREKCDGERPTVDLDNPDICFHLHINRDLVSFYLDFSGKALSHRGYRRAQTKAVLSEFLASSLLSRSQFLKNEETKVLLDPFCGSGTICIEAALWASKTAPGLIDVDRFAFFKLPFFDQEAWQEVWQDADDQQTTPQKKIIGWDIDPRAIEIAKKNARAAGVDQYIEFKVKDFLTTTVDDIPKEKGCIVTDPPYGFRLNESDQDTKKLYSSMGKVITTVFEGWNASILCGDKSLLSYVDMKPDRVNTLYNGGIECQLAHYYVYTAQEKQALIDKAIAKREQRLSEPLTPGAQMAANRLKKNLEALKPLMQEQKVSCYRIYDADMPEYSAAIDMYEGKYISLQEYQAPATIDPEAAQRRLNELIMATERVTGIDLENIYVKQRSIQHGKNQYTRWGKTDKFYIIHEGGHKFMVNFADFLDTGIFLDHRPARNLIQSMAEGKRFLNLFCYTATCTVYAAAGGALSTVSVDASGTYLDWAQKNMKLNGFDSLNHFYYMDDCMRYLSSNRDQFDLIFCDPPTFSNSKSRDTFNVQYDHSNLIKACMAHLSKDGVLIFSTNFTKFKFDEYLKTLYKVEDISLQTIGADFERNQKIHYCYKITHQEVKPIVKKKLKAVLKEK